MMVGFCRRLTPALLLAYALQGWAQGLADPTRPPNLPMAGQGEGAAGNVLAGPGLQSVMLPKKGKPAALIDGQWVRLGEKVGESRVIGITETEVLLRGPQGRETLHMFPAVAKTPSAGETREKQDKAMGKRK